MLQALSAQQQTQQRQPPTQAAASLNPQSLITAQKAATANAAHNAPVTSPYDTFMSNLAGATGNANRANSAASMQHMAPEQNISSPKLPQAQQNDPNQASALSQVLSNLIRGSQSQAMTGKSADVNELIDALRKGHDKQNQQEENKAFFGDGETAASFNTNNSRTTSSLTDPPSEERATKKRAGVAFHPLDDSANISSEGTSDDTKNKGSTSSFTLSDEGCENHDKVPLKKRIKSSTSGKDGITSKNLADHNIRMQQRHAENDS